MKSLKALRLLRLSLLEMRKHRIENKIYRISLKASSDLSDVAANDVEKLNSMLGALSSLLKTDSIVAYTDEADIGGDKNV